jgi:D-alanyl-D-alanine dipeptidase
MYRLTTNSFFVTLLLGMTMHNSAFAQLSQEARANGFVYLHEIDPTIQISVRYNSSENFLGTPVDDYKASAIIMTKQAAAALLEVQRSLKKDGYCLVVYDAYRPQQAVDHFMRWADNVADQLKKQQYYPRVHKADVFELGYVAKRSGHSRGSTVDVTLIKDGQKIGPIREQKRTLTDGSTIFFLDDGTVDMGSSFDLFDEVSHGDSNLVTPEQKKMRAYLKSIMEKHGFKTISEEWWHFTLKNEPFSASLDGSYFNFPVE